MPFPYKNVLVIGATSGIGEALAGRLILAGAHVIVVGRRKGRLELFAQDHGEHRVSTDVFDITDLENIPAFANRITEKHPDLDCVLMNSGIQRSIDFTNPDSIDFGSVATELNTNYLAYVHLTAAFIPILRMQAQKSAASLIYTTSSLALVPITRCPNYCASKAALHNFILCLREQLRETGVKVVEILPPAVQTELHNENNQPDLKNGAKIGITLSQFMDEAWAGLESEKSDIPVGVTKDSYENFEYKRQALFRQMLSTMPKKQ